MSGKMSGHKKKIHPIVEENFYVRNEQQCMCYGILRAKNYVKLKLFEWGWAYTKNENKRNAPLHTMNINIATRLNYLVYRMNRYLCNYYVYG